MDLQNLPPPILPILKIFEHNFLEKNIPNKTLRKCLDYQTFPIKPNKNSIIQKFSAEDVKKIWTKYLKLPLSPKTKEIHFKILNEIYPSNEILRKIFNI